MSHTKFAGWQSEKDFTAWNEETERIDRELAERFIKLTKARRRRQTISHNRAKPLKAAIIGLGLSLLLIWYGFKPLLWAIAKLLG